MKRKSLISKKDKKGQIESIIFAVIIIAVIGIIFFFFNHMNKQVYDSFDKYFESDADLNQTEAHLALENIQSVEGSNIWDWVFLATFMGLMIQMIIFSFASKQNLVFFWLFVVIGIVVLFLGIILSNIWQELVAKPEFIETLARFPITNAILGSYFPTIVTGVFFLTLIILFGKFPGRQE